MTTKYHLARTLAYAFLASISFYGCERSMDELEPASYPVIPEVFIDGFSSGLDYAAFGNSVVTAFDIENDVTYNNSSASMRFEVPDVNDPRGSYVGGVFYTSGGRDLREFDALTFWVKASQPATLDVVGFGNDLGDSKYLASLSALPVNSNWTKIIIPIPDPSRLRAEKGMLYLAEGPENGRGYTLWIDEVKFEKLGIAPHRMPTINNGQIITLSKENGEDFDITGLTTTFNLPTGASIAVGTAPGYYEFTSSNPAVATVNELGRVSVLTAGTTTLTATMGGVNCTGSTNLTSTGASVRPTVAAPTPTRPANQVISLFSNAYTNVPVDTWNPYWQFSTAVETFMQIAGDDVIRYRSLNFVGIEFVSQQINATSMTHFHIDVWTPDNTALPKQFKVLLVDFGANGVYGGGDDSSHELTFTSPTLSSQNWISLDIPLSSFTGLTSRTRLSQLVLSGDLPTIYIDNVYFYNSGIVNPTAPTVAAPIPTHSAGSVISVFSNSYTNISGLNLNPGWGQSTVVSQIAIAGNNTLKYTGLNYQGIEFGSNQNVSSLGFLHIDFWTANSSTLKVFLISPGPVETPFTLTVPTTGWQSVDIPLSSFSPVDLTRVFQMKFEGNGDIYLDNIYFHN